MIIHKTPDLYIIGEPTILEEMENLILAHVLVYGFFVE